MYKKKHGIIYLVCELELNYKQWEINCLSQGVCSREMGSMMTRLCLSSAYRSSSDSREKPAAMEPPDLPPLDIDDLPSKAHDSAPPSINDHVRLDFMVGMGSLGFVLLVKIPSPFPDEIPPTNSYKNKIIFFLEFIII